MVLAPQIRGVLRAAGLQGSRCRLVVHAIFSVDDRTVHLLQVPQLQNVEEREISALLVLFCLLRDDLLKLPTPSGMQRAPITASLEISYFAPCGYVSI